MRYDVLPSLNEVQQAFCPNRVEKRTVPVYARDNISGFSELVKYMDEEITYLSTNRVLSLHALWRIDGTTLETLAVVKSGAGECLFVKGWLFLTVVHDSPIADHIQNALVGDKVYWNGMTFFVASDTSNNVLSYEECHQIEHQRSLRLNAQVLEDLAKEQELQEARRLQQEQANKQREETKQKQQTIDKYAGQYERSTGTLAYEQAIIQYKAIKHHIEEGASSQIILERAAVLRSRCTKSRDAVASSNAQAPASDGEGAAVGAIIGGVLGILGGLPGMAFGAVAGGLIGKMTDQPSSSPEQKQWTTLMRDIDELASKMLG